MARILRGDLYWADLNPVRGHKQSGVRPVVVISHDVFNERSGTVIVMAITSREPAAGFPLSLALPKTSLPKPSWVKVSQIRTISTERLGKRAGRVSPEELQQLVGGLYDIIASAC